MAEDRVACNPVPPDLSQPEILLEYLLKIEIERLAVAVKIEKARNIVFPETSVIIHDIARLQTALARKSKRDVDIFEAILGPRDE